MLRYILASGVRDRLRFTVTPTGNRTLTLQDFTPPIACAVDWGDGARSVLTSAAPLSHTYADGTPRVVEISGLLGGFWNAATRAAGTAFVTSVDELASRSLVTLAETFRQCTALATIPATVDAPNLAACDRCFSHCRSITSGLPALWLTHPAATHANCFTNCFLSCWGKMGSGCTYRQYVAAVAGQTYWQKYGTGCPSRSWVSGTASRTYWQAYSNGTRCPAATKVGAVAARTFYQQYGTKCASASTVAARTYYQQYGNGSTCPARKYVAGGSQTYYVLYGDKCTYRTGAYGTCTKCGARMVYAGYNGGTRCSAKAGSGYFTDICGSCGNKQGRYSSGLCSASCPKTKTSASYYSCTASSASGVTTCSSSCRRVYQAASTKCTATSLSGVTTCSSSCRRQYQVETAAYTKCTASGSSGVTTCGSGCKRVYSAGTSGYYTCKVSSSSGTSRCGSGCKRTYTSGQSAYYRCTKGGTCATTGCPWPYANETACANAKSAGWA